MYCVAMSPAVLPSPAIHARGLTRRFGDLTAVDDLDLTVPRGTVAALLGPNGAGKSTTMRMLTTLSRPTAGTLEVLGLDPATHPEQVRRRIGVVAQGSGADPNATGRENLWLQGRLHGMSRAALAPTVEALLTQVGLTAAADRPTGGWSGGMRRRLDLAMALVASPEVLLLDEPTVGLDPEVRRDLWDLLGGLVADDGLTVLLTTHHLEEAETLADHVTIIDQGRVVARGTPAALRQQVDGDVVDLALSAHDDAAIAAVAGLPDVHGAHAIDGGVRITAADGARLLPTLLAILADAGLEVRSIAVTRPSLEQAYLAATGNARAA